MSRIDNFSSTIPPTVPSVSPWNWLRTNLFSTWYNVIITGVCLVLIGQGLMHFIRWAFGTAQWAVIGANLHLFIVGRFPPQLYWRVWLSLVIIGGLTGLSWGVYQRNTRLWNRSILVILSTAVLATLLFPLGLTPRLWMIGTIVITIASIWIGRQFFNPNLSRWLPLAWGLAFFMVLWFLKGGFGLEPTSTNVLTGLLLTLLVAIISIILSFPLGVVLALGRQSDLPVVRWCSIFYIEVIRGLPLIGILFLAQVMLPLFFPPDYREIQIFGMELFDRVLRAIAGLVLFSAAYLAENVRGGLQAVPRGQTEAAKALGLSTPLVISLIVLPQALKAVIPAIVGQFIGLFKDTSLLALFGLLELTGIARSVLAQPQFLGRYAEVYLFIGLIYWIVCYGMSLASRRLEQQLNIGQH
ncbi:MAG TPA: amino acid ABC transporter permease [Coleofasciculaceae cyanobacterium]